MSGLLGAPMRYRWELAPLALALLPDIGGPFLFLPLFRAGWSPYLGDLALVLVAGAIWLLLFPGALRRGRPLLTALWLVVGAVLATSALLAPVILAVTSGALPEHLVRWISPVRIALLYPAVAYVALRYGRGRDALLIAAAFLVIAHVAALTPAPGVLPLVSATVLGLLWGAVVFQLSATALVAVLFGTYEHMTTGAQRAAVASLLAVPVVFTLALGIGFEMTEFSFGPWFRSFLMDVALPRWPLDALNYLVLGGLLLLAIWTAGRPRSQESPSEVTA